MAKIIGISGSQGQGKSTTINAALEENDNIHTLNIQTAREALTDWGYSLTEVNSFMPLKVKFQEELLARHCNSLGFPREWDGVYLVERTFADIFNYALVSVGPFNDYSEWLNDYANRCAAAQEKYFDHVVLLSGREYVPEDDGVRSVNPHFSGLVDYVIQTYTIKFGWDGKENDKVSFLNVPDLDKRVEFILDLCNKIDQ